MTTERDRVDTERVDIGPLHDIPTHRAVSVVDGQYVAVRVADNVSVFPNTCLHADQALVHGVVSDGVLTCPQHFWRYNGENGQLLGPKQPAGELCLERLETEIVDSQVFVWVPTRRPTGSIRETLLEHARNWERDQT